MLYANRIKELRDNKQMLQRHISSALDIDNALYYRKIESGNRLAKREQVLKLAQIFETVEKELLTIWLADKVVYEHANEVASNALKVAEKEVKYNKRR